MKKRRNPSAAQPGKARTLSASADRGRNVVIPEKWQPYYRKLQELRDTLLSQNGNLLRDAREPVGTAGTHVAESGTDEFDRGLHFNLLATEQNALHEVEAALGRIEDGTYGVCEFSGRHIPAPRLKAIPWTRYTAPVEAEFEKARRTGAPLPRSGMRVAAPKAKAPSAAEPSRSRARRGAPKRST